VFTTLLGRPHHAATISRAFQAALDRAGLPRSRFHDLRHAAATFMLGRGMTLEDVKNQLAHSSITLTSDGRVVVLAQRQRPGDPGDSCSTLRGPGDRRCRVAEAGAVVDHDGEDRPGRPAAPS
jgi:hypothetical protein